MPNTTCSNSEKEVLLSIIKLYKERPFLWNKSQKGYYNKDIRAEGFKVILEAYKTFDKSIDPKTLKKKIENMRTSYTRELKKVMASKQDAGPDDVYVPQLWYYKALSFLGDTTTESRKSVKATDPLLTDNENSSSDDENQNISTYSTGQKRKKVETLMEKQGNLLETVEKLMTKMSHKDEPWQVYGRAIGYQVKDLRENQLVICQKLISDAIFYAKLNKLNEYSHVATPSDEP